VLASQAWHAHPRILAWHAHPQPYSRGSATISASVDAQSVYSTSAAIDTLWNLPCTQEECIVGDEDPNVGGPLPNPMRVSRFTTVSKLWTHEDWERHVHPNRMLFNILTWPYSTIIRALWPVLLALLCWTRVVWLCQLSFTPTALGFLASPLGLLLAFRVNSVVARFHEARSMWGMLIFTARDASSTLAAAHAKIPLATRLRCCRLLVCFGWAVKAATRPEDDVRPVLDALLPADEAATVAASRKPPLALLSRLRKTLQPLPLPHHVALHLQTSVSELNRHYGGMERLLSTPLSPTYMRHALRGLLLWFAMLPCGLLSAGCKSWAKLAIVCVATAYIMLGIDEIGVQIENPFEVLPLHGLAAVLTKDVVEELLGQEDADA